MSNIQTILCPTDFSESADRAFQVACSMARDLGAKLIVMHVFPLPYFHGEVVDRRQGDDYYEALWQELYRRAPVDPCITVDHRLREGEAAEQINEAAREENCGLIVIGTHGRSGLGRLLLGSVAERIIRTAPCAVLTVNPHTTFGNEPAAAAPVSAASCCSAGGKEAAAPESAGTS